MAAMGPAQAAQAQPTMPATPYGPGAWGPYTALVLWVALRSRSLRHGGGARRADLLFDI